MAEKTLYEETGGSGKSHKSVYIIGILVVIAIIAVASYYVLTIWEGQPSVSNCGNAVCDPGETYTNCPSDCQQPPPPSGPQKVSVSPSTQNVNVGNTVKVEIKISNANDLYGFQFDIEYNPDLLKYESIEEGGFLSRNGADTTYPMNGTASSGAVEDIVGTRLGGVGGVNGEGTLEILTFTALSAGDSEIKISNIKFLNSKIQEIQTNVENGQVTVS
ncbi:MAG: hypothetical protein GTN76_14280 [Candidatus Aenigmarchaeota archaeon]|nr:hypothetical protein [Candidatus Aenigmarchaeota archaeon]